MECPLQCRALCVPSVASGGSPVWHQECPRSAEHCVPPLCHQDCSLPSTECPLQCVPPRCGVSGPLLSAGCPQGLCSSCQHTLPEAEAFSASGASSSSAMLQSGQCEFRRKDSGQGGGTHKGTPHMATQVLSERGCELLFSMLRGHMCHCSLLFLGTGMCQVHC